MFWPDRQKPGASPGALRPRPGAARRQEEPGQGRGRRGGCPDAEPGCGGRGAAGTRTPPWPALRALPSSAGAGQLRGLPRGPRKRRRRRELCRERPPALPPARGPAACWAGISSLGPGCRPSPGPCPQAPGGARGGRAAGVTPRAGRPRAGASPLRKVSSPPVRVVGLRARLPRGTLGATAGVPGTCASARVTQRLRSHGYAGQFANAPAPRARQASGSRVPLTPGALGSVRLRRGARTCWCPCPPVPPAWVASAGPRLRALPVGTAPEGVPCSPPRAPRRAPDHGLWHGARSLAPLCPPPATAATSTAHGTSRPRAPRQEAPAASGRSPSVAECKCPSCSDPGPPHLPESLAERPLLRVRSLPFTRLPHALAPVICVGLVK